MTFPLTNWCGDCWVGDNFKAGKHTFKRISNTHAICITPGKTIQETWGPLDFILATKKTTIGAADFILESNAYPLENEGALQDELNYYQKIRSLVWRSFLQLPDLSLDLLSTWIPETHSLGRYQSVVGFLKEEQIRDTEMSLELGSRSSLLVPSFASPSWVQGAWVLTPSTVEWVQLMGGAIGATGLLKCPIGGTFEVCGDVSDIFTLSSTPRTRIAFSHEGTGHPSFGKLLIPADAKLLDTALHLESITPQCEVIYPGQDRAGINLWSWVWKTTNKAWPPRLPEPVNPGWIGSISENPRARKWLEQNYLRLGYTRRVNTLDRLFPVLQRWKINNKTVEEHKDKMVVRTTSGYEEICNFRITVTDVTSYYGGDISYRLKLDNATDTASLVIPASYFRKPSLIDTLLTQVPSSGDNWTVYSRKHYAQIESIVRIKASTVKVTTGHHVMGGEASNKTFVSPVSELFDAAPIDPDLPEKSNFVSTLPTGDITLADSIASRQYACKVIAVLGSAVFRREDCYVTLPLRLSATICRAVGQRSCMTFTHKNAALPFKTYPVVVRNSQSAAISKCLKYMIKIQHDNQEAVDTTNMDNFISAVYKAMVSRSGASLNDCPSGVGLINLGAYFIRKFFDPHFSLSDSGSILHEVAMVWPFELLQQRCRLSFESQMVTVYFDDDQELARKFQDACHVRNLTSTLTEADNAYRVELGVDHLQNSVFQIYGEPLQFLQPTETNNTSSVGN